jgi:hypothetical protein
LRLQRLPSLTFFSRCVIGIHRNQNWGDCADGSKNEWNIEVPKNGAYLVSIHSQNIGSGPEKTPFSVENVRSIGESQAMAVHPDGTTCVFTRYFLEVCQQRIVHPASSAIATIHFLQE